jgi:hypothetical protein
MSPTEKENKIVATKKTFQNREKIFNVDRILRERHHRRGSHSIRQGSTLLVDFERAQQGAMRVHWPIASLLARASLVPKV